MTHEELEKVIAFEKKSDARVEKKLEAIAQQGPKADSQPSIGSMFSEPMWAGDVIETDILREDSRYKVLTWEELQKAFQVGIDEELPKYERLEDPNVAKELVRKELIKTLYGNRRPVPDDLPYEMALKKYRVIKQRQAPFYQFSYLRFHSKTIGLAAAEYLKEAPGAVHFFGLVLDETLADVFAQGRNGYFVFYRLPALDVLKKLKIRGEMVVKEPLNEEQAQALVDIPMKVSIHEDMPPESLERVLPILKKKQNFTYDLFSLKRITPKLLEEELQPVSKNKFGVFSVESFSVDLVDACQQYGIDEVYLQYLKTMDADTARAFMDAGIRVHASADFVVRNVESLAVVFPHAHEFILDGASEEVEDIFSWLRANNDLKKKYNTTIRLANFPLTHANAKLLLGIWGVQFELEEPLTDEAAGILRHASARIKAGRKELTLKHAGIFGGAKKLIHFMARRAA